MFGTKIKSTESTPTKAPPRTLFRSARYATAGRGLQASRGLPIGTRTPSSRAAGPALPADRMGAAVTLLLGLALTAGGAFMVSQIWANLAMIR